MVLPSQNINVAILTLFVLLWDDEMPKWEVEVWQMTSGYCVDVNWTYFYNTEAIRTRNASQLWNDCQAGSAFGKNIWGT